jgi:hypothetical protein
VTSKVLCASCCHGVTASLWSGDFKGKGRRSRWEDNIKVDRACRKKEKMTGGQVPTVQNRLMGREGLL